MPIADDYNDVAARIREFREKHPEGSLQPADLNVPYRIETIGEKSFVVYVAAAYRSPDDTKPGIGAAWEPFPGPTNFTKNSELQNAETSAWGRAIVAALAADTKRGIATTDEIERRQAEHVETPPPATKGSLSARVMEINALIGKHGKTVDQVHTICAELAGEGKRVDDLSLEQYSQLKSRLSASPAPATT